MKTNTKEKQFSVGWIVYFCISILVVIIASISQNSGIAMLVSSVSGIVYVLLIAKDKKQAYIFGIINVIIYGIILFNQKIYGTAVYNIIYCLPMYIYGYFNWKKVEKQENSGIKTLSNKTRVIGSVITVIAIAMYTFAVSYIGGNFALIDGILVIAGFLAVYLLANKYIEQWPVYIVMNISGTIMWTILTIENVRNLPIALMWLTYTINSVYAFIAWIKIIKKK